MLAPPSTKIIDDAWADTSLKNCKLKLGLFSTTNKSTWQDRLSKALRFHSKLFYEVFTSGGREPLLQQKNAI